MAHASRSLLVAGLFSFALAGLACKGELSRGDAGDDAGVVSTLTCAVASDCTRGEIDHEIRSRADCICLFGCAWEIMNVETANRRMAQYQAWCTPGRDAQGQPCPIDDCALPPPLTCLEQMCVVAATTQ